MWSSLLNIRSALFSVCHLTQYFCQTPDPLFRDRSVAWQMEIEKPITGSVQLPNIPVSSFSLTDLFLVPIYCELADARSCKPELTYLAVKDAYKIGWSVKIPWNRHSMRVACWWWWAPDRDECLYVRWLQGLWTSHDGRCVLWSVVGICIWNEHQELERGGPQNCKLGNKMICP